jgi:hypothetical protein
MKEHNPANERIKRKYFSFLKEAKRHSEPMVDAAAKALSRFENYTGSRDFNLYLLLYNLQHCFRLVTLLSNYH